MIILVGILTGLLVFVLATSRPTRRGRGVASRKLAEMYSLETTRTLAELKPGSLEYRLLAAGWSMTTATFYLLTGGTGLVTVTAAWLFLPGIPAIVLGGIAAFIPSVFLGSQVTGRTREIDRRLPVAIGRIAAGLLAGGAVAEVLEKTGESLDLEGANPLTPELLLTAADLRSKGRQEALESLAARSASPSLSNLANLLMGYTEAGGGRYADALLDATRRIQQVLVARGRAQAKAGDALLSARIIPGVLLVVLIYLLQDPLIRGSLGALTVQLTLGAGMAVMAGGYLVLASIVSEAA
ncbi:MAG: hypothetical protein PHQ40_08695 [Anaerolineaceae bacterium]|nr:hypothetical protein [Anaerolineaceae bacterium]